MDALILGLTALYFALLALERARARRDRARLRHVVHVNGTRGKSTVSRLIEAGLRAGGYRVFCKTTGTDPMTIGVDGTARPIRRVGPSNIREQLRILHRAASEGAEVLVAECMAVQPELQYTAQHDMLLADVGVITNVRRDHTDVMGESLEEICRSLCGTVPRGGVVLTAERSLAPRIGERAAALGSRFRAVEPSGDEPDFDFAENIALALAVCEELGVGRERALEGMARFQPDPFALAVYRLGEGVFVNALSANDPTSTRLIYDKVLAELKPPAERRILLLNNRDDRGARTRDMLLVARALAPDEVWLTGAGQGWLARRLRRELPDAPVLRLRGGDPRLTALRRGELVFAAGNVAGEGRKLMERVREEGERIV